MSAATAPAYGELFQSTPCFISRANTPRLLLAGRTHGFQSTPCFISRANCSSDLITEAVAMFQSTPCFISRANHYFFLLQDCISVSIHALLHQQGEPTFSSSSIHWRNVSIHALLHQQGEPIVMGYAYYEFEVSIHALLHQQGELAVAAHFDFLNMFQSTPCFISRANCRGFIYLLSTTLCDSRREPRTFHYVLHWIDVTRPPRP